jgi:YD repeat-containing protein
VTTTKYDAAGEVTATIDGLNKTTTFTYDAAGEQTAVTDPLSCITTTTYNADGQVSTVKDALSHIEVDPNVWTKYPGVSVNRKTPRQETGKRERPPPLAGLLGGEEAGRKKKSPVYRKRLIAALWATSSPDR